MKSDKISYT